MLVVWQSCDLQSLNSCTHAALVLFSQLPFSVFQRFLPAYQVYFLRGGSSDHVSSQLSLLKLHFTPPLQHLTTALPPLHSPVYHTPSKALCSVPFLPLPRVLFDTPGMLMGQSETLSLRISLWLIFIHPPFHSQIYNLCCLQLQMFCSAFYSL